MSHPSTLRRTRHLRLTARAWGALAVGVACVGAAYVSGRNELLVGGVFCLALALTGILVGVLRRPRLDVVRTFTPPLGSAGSPSHVTLKLRNRGAISTPTVLWNDALPWESPHEPRELAPLGWGAMRTSAATVDYTVTPWYRGVFPVGPLAVEYGDPFGMTRGVTAVGRVDTLTVVPPIWDLTADGPIRADGDGVAHLIQRRALGNDDDLTTREYRAGDAMRRVHWRASARYGQLMVRQEEHRSHPDARIMLDTRRSGYPDAVADPKSWSDAPYSDAFEWVVEMLASLALHLDAEGYHVSVLESGSPQVAPLGERWEGSSRADEFVASLASVQIREGEEGIRPPSGDPNAAGPIFALVADADDEVVDWLIHGRRPGQRCAVFLVGTRVSARERLQDAGWMCMDVAATDDVRDVWRLSRDEAVNVRGSH